MIACLVLTALVGTVAGPAQAATWNGRFSIWRNGAFAPQYTDFSCVGATIQIMVNLVRNRADKSRRGQFAYLDHAQERSRYPVTDLGADPQGWAQALRDYGAGDDYGWANDPTIEGSLHTAAKQIRRTGKPVGLLVHFGRHAWVMSGFESTADPAQSDDFEVTAAEVVGPLWPSGTLNGRPFDPGPQTWMDVRTLSRKFDRYVEPGHDLWRDQYVTIVPRASEAAQPPAPEPPADAVDLRSAFGWVWVFNQLAYRIAVRDLLWLR